MYNYLNEMKLWLFSLKNKIQLFPIKILLTVDINIKFKETRTNIIDYST